VEGLMRRVPMGAVAGQATEVFCWTSPALRAAAPVTIFIVEPGA
jgi:hypothetical protein